MNYKVLENLSACFHHFKASKFRQLGRFYNQAPNQSNFLAFPFLSCCCDGSQQHICALRCCFEVAGPDSLSSRPWLTAKGQEAASPLLGHLLEMGTTPPVPTPSWSHLSHNKDLTWEPSGSEDRAKRHLGAVRPLPGGPAQATPSPREQLPVLAAVPWFSVPLARAGPGFCFFTVTSPASWGLVFNLPTLRSQLSVFGFLLWG